MAITVTQLKTFLAVVRGGSVTAAAVYAGARRPLTDANLLRAFIAQPLLAAQVLGAIHWEALKLWRKGLRLRSKPLPPAELVSLVHDESSAGLRS